MRSSLVVAACLATLCPAVAAGQTRPTARLRVEAVEGACFEEPALREEVATQLGYDPFEASAEREVGVQVLAPEEGPEIRITLTTEEGSSLERTLLGRPEECPALLDAAALAVCIAIDPTALDRPDPAPPEPEPEPAPAPEPVPTPEPPVVSPPAEPAPTPEPEDPVWLRVALSGFGTLGAAPTVVGGGGSLALTLGLEDVSFGLGVRGDVPTSIGVDPGSVEALLLAGELAICGWVDPIGVCALGVAGAVRGQGRDFAGGNETIWLPYAGIGARVTLYLPLAGPLGFRAYADLLAQVTPAELLVDDRVAWSMPPVGGVLGVGVDVSLF